MLSFFRKGVTEKIMLVVLVVALAAIVITGFGTGGVGGLGGLGSGGSDTVISVEGEKITSADVQQQIQRQVARAREQQPELSIAQFLAGNMYENILRDMTAQKALTVFGRDQGFAASQQMVNGEIANIPAFRNLAGQFDPEAFRAALARERVSEQQLRRELADGMIQRQMYLPVTLATHVPEEMARQYASLLLEQRTGTIGVVPAAAMGPGREPSDAEVTAFYRANQQRYMIPERRVIRYAAFGRETLGQAAVATPAEIEAFYKANQATYGPKETRTLSQVVLPDQAAARAFAAKLAAGTSFEQAAREAGFSTSDTAIGEQTQEGLANLASAAVAQAAFGAAAGATTQPLQSPLGWHIVRVDAINREAGRPLAAVQDEIRTQIEAQKGQTALADKVTKIEDAIADGASLEEVARAQGLTISETPLITGAGAQPGVADAPPLSPEIAPLLQPAFEMEADDDPEVQTLAQNERFAVFQIGRVAPAAAPPLAEIAARVKADLGSQRAMERARAVATSIVAKLNAGTPPAQAFAQTDVKLPPAQQVSMRRIQLMQTNQQVPPALSLLFSLPSGRARVMPAENGEGWYVVYNQNSVRGDSRQAPGLIQATRQQFQQTVGEEYAAQFIRAVEAKVSIRRNEDAIRATRQQLAGPGAQ